MRAFFRSIFRRHVLVRAAFILACVATLIVAYYQYVAWRGRSAWADYRAAAAQRGESLDLADYHPPAIPPAENFAALPLFEELFRADAAGEPPENPLPLPDRKPRKAREPLPFLGKPRDLADWRDAMVQAKWIAAPSNDVAQDILRGLERYRADLDAFHEAAQRPSSQFPVRWQDGFAARLPHLHTLLHASEIFSLRASAQLIAGQSAAAWSDVQDILRLASAIDGEFGIISGFVRLSILSKAMANVWEGLARGAWSDEDLRQIERAFAQRQLMRDMRFALASERRVLNHELQRILAGNTHDLATFFALAKLPAEENSSPHLGLSLYPRGWLFENLLAANRLFDERIALADPESETIRSGPSVEESLRKITGASSLGGPRYTLLRLTFPTFPTFDSRYLYAHARLQQARAACALERFHRAHARLPETLAELTPAFLPKLPHDAATGAPLQYRKTGPHAYELWTVGKNRRDDGGLTDPEKDIWDQPDCVWRITREP